LGLAPPSFVPCPGEGRLKGGQGAKWGGGGGCGDWCAGVVAHEISKILDTGLDKETLAILIGLLENGVNPEALAQVVKELRREAAALKSAI